MRISKLGYKRLWRLVDYMQSLPASANKHFSMSYFFMHKYDDHQHLVPKNPTVKDLHACNTTACALGWAMTVPAFRRAGLYIRKLKDTDAYSVENAEKVFGITGCDFLVWGTLFGEFNVDPTPKAWAKRVSKLLRQWQREEAEGW